jgi:hypothetical protein
MSALRDPRLEIFARELAAALNNAVPPSEAAVQAATEARYPPAKRASTFAANARKRAQRADVSKRVAELRAPGIRKAEEAIGITTEYLLAKLDNLTNFNIDDYLTGRDKAGRRTLDLSDVPRDVLGRLSEVAQDVVETGGKKARRSLVRTKIKGYGVIDGIRLMAQIKGLMAPEKRDLTIHATDQMTDDELARIAAGGSQGAPATPGTP